MPRQSRIDAPGALHHLIIRGIERKTIVKDHADRNEFVERMESIFGDSSTPCFARTLMTNHVHLLSRTADTPGRYPAVVQARSILCFMAVRELGVTATELARQMGLTQPAISMSVNHGEGLVKEKKLSIDDFLA